MKGRSDVIHTTIYVQETTIYKYVVRSFGVLVMHLLVNETSDDME